ncbi:MAG: GGDEF domain-containing protein [Desulfobacterales bacterium]|nr:GGDEF domain-containing protein [Desulfobacterales bacterium]
MANNSTHFIDYNDWPEIVVILKNIEKYTNLKLTNRERKLISALDEKVYPACNPECADFTCRKIPFDFDTRLLAYLTTNPSFSEKDRTLILKAVMTYASDQSQPLEKLSVYVIKEFRKAIASPFYKLEETVQQLEEKINILNREVVNKDQYAARLLEETAFLATSIQDILKNTIGKVITSEGTVLEAFEKEISNDKIIEIIQNQNKKFIKSLKEESKKAITDPLTTLYNRGAFEVYFDEAFNDCKQSDEPLSAIFIDIDFFKKVNDTYGHQVGDEAIMFVVDHIKNTIMSENIFIARYGGEEFIVILKGYNLRKSVSIAESIRINVENEAFSTQDKKITHKITISLGVAQLEKNMQKSSELLEMADKALYNAKNSGRNKVIAQSQ